MDLERSSPPPDPEFGSNRPGLLFGDLGGEPEVYTRLVANPFLALAFLAGWLIALYESIVGGFAGPLTPSLVAVLFCSLGLIPFLLHYHCLDCGRTGRIMQWRKHVCRKSLGRRESNRPRRLRGPTPPVQVIFWIWALIAAVALLSQAGWSLTPS